MGYIEGFFIICFLSVWVSGTITWNKEPEDLILCDGGSTNFTWIYTTDEPIGTVSWQKQPGNVAIATYIVGSDKFIVDAAYTGRITRGSNGNAEFILSDIKESDNGAYSATVAGTSTLTSERNASYFSGPPNGTVQISALNSKNSTCLPPSGTTGVTITVQWMGEVYTGKDGVYLINTCKGGQFSCSMNGGPASCGSGSYSSEKYFKKCYLWILISLIFILPDVIFTTVMKVLMKKKHLNLCFGLWWILMIASPVIGFGITLVVTFVPCFDCCVSAAGYGILIGIFSGPSIVVKILFLCKCCDTDSKGCPTKCTEIVSPKSPQKDNELNVSPKSPQKDNELNREREDPHGKTGKEAENEVSPKAKTPRKKNRSAKGKEKKQKKKKTKDDIEQSENYEKIIQGDIKASPHGRLQPLETNLATSPRKLPVPPIATDG